MSDIPTPEQLVDRARALIPKLIERWEQAATGRKVPEQTVAEMREAGLFRVLQPKRYGGYEMDPQVFYKIQIALAEGCMSTAWIYGVIAVHNWQLALYDDRAQQDVWGKNQNTLISSSYMPKAKVTPVEGGYRVSGRWGFSSGVDHCDWAFLGGVTPEDGEFRTFLIPRGDFKVVDAWDTVGLRGTGSQDVEVNDAFVPTYRTHKSSDGAKGTSPGVVHNTAPLYQLPFGQIFVRAVSTSSIGALQGALNAYLDWNGKRVAVNDASKSAEDPMVQQTAAEAALAIDEMKVALFRNFDSMMSKLRAGQPLDMNDRIHYRTQSASVPERCADLVNRLFYNAGAHGMYRTSRLTRYFLDINCGRTHVANNIYKIERNYGGVLLGLPNTDTFL
ncbi:MAG: acyl-CoA dehydrogenase family protein [Proteobacteria bacterium]|nr:acyl-CoA dehydrogenase family protein [Pseudomonadota bacterium]HQR04393.1 acyl-CoA dehydrogenase family protein [Rhodocyclaceae bacterium]